MTITSVNRFYLIDTKFALTSSSQAVGNSLPGNLAIHAWQKSENTPLLALIFNFFSRHLPFFIFTTFWKIWSLFLFFLFGIRNRFVFAWSTRCCWKCSLFFTSAKKDWIKLTSNMHQCHSFSWSPSNIDSKFLLEQISVCSTNLSTFRPIFDQKFEVKCEGGSQCRRSLSLPDKDECTLLKKSN